MTPTVSLRVTSDTATLQVRLSGPRADARFVEIDGEVHEVSNDARRKTFWGAFGIAKTSRHITRLEEWMRLLMERS